MSKVKKTIKTTKKKHSGKATRTTALLLVMALVFSFIPSFSGSAASNYLPISNTWGEPLKREVIYGKLAANGSSQSIYVVNHYELSEMQSFNDYGNYSNVLQLTGNRAPQLDLGVVNLQAAAGSYYYQGNLESTDLPWLINITYELNGQEITAAQASGATGELLIKIETRQNSKIDPFFFENYALQVSATLDPDKARLLETDGAATVAISGKDRLITWIAFPGQETDLYLRLEAKEFEMASMTFAGIGLDFYLDFAIEDFVSDEETEGLNELSDGVRQLAEGAEELEGAIAQLKAGFAEIESGSGSLANSGSQLSKGAGDLQSGSAQLGQGLAEYTGGVTSIKNGMSGLTGGLTQLRAGIAQLESNGTILSSASDEILAALQQISAGLSDNFDLEEIGSLMPSDSEIEFLKRLSALLKEVDSFFDQFLSAIKSLEEMYAELTSLKEQIKILIEKVKALLDEAGNLPALKPELLNLDEQGWRNYLQVYINSYGVDITLNAEDELLSDLAKLSSSYSFSASALETLQDLTRLDIGISAIEPALEQLLSLVEEYDLSDLADSCEAMKSGLNLIIKKLDSIISLLDNLPAMVSGLSELSSGLNYLSSEYEKFNSGLSEYTKGVSQVLTAIDGTTNQAGLISGAQQLEAGLGELDANSSSLTAGMSGFSAGVAEYKVGIDTYLQGVSSLNQGLVDFETKGLNPLASGFGTYAEGAGEFRDATANLLADFLKQMDEVITEYLDMDFEPRSFVSDKNTNVIGVQFVMMTESISIPKDTNGSTFELEDEGDFLSRLRGLFIKDND